MRTTLHRLVLLFEAIAPLTLTSSMLSVLTAIAYDYVCTGTFKPLKSSLLLIGIILLHIGINLYNDYRDYVSGVDEAYRRVNVLHRLNMIIDLGVSPSAVKRASIVLLLTAAALGLTLVVLSHALVALGLAFLGVAIGYLYSVFLRKSGIGELLAGLAVGPGVVLGALDVLDNLKLSIIPPLIIGLVNGLYTMMILTIIALTRANVDRIIGKRTIAVALGYRKCKIALYITACLQYILTILLAVHIGSPIPLASLALTPLLARAVVRNRVREVFYYRLIHVGILIISLLA